MKNFLVTISFLLLLCYSAKAQNNLCSNPTPFCTGQTMQFPAGVNAGSAQTGPNYGCLGSQPNPAWFYFQMGTSGPVVITMSAGQDIDFIAYGPFGSLSGNCGNLTAANTVGCSYSGSATETLTINNAVAGQFYILMITNFSNANQQITFSQTNSNNAGAGITNCGVLCSMTVTGTSSLCAGKTATLSATTGTGVVSVTWNGPAGFSSTGNNASVPNMSSTGVYTAIATTSGTNPATNTCSISKTITVLPLPNPLPSNNGPVCPGKPVTLSVGAQTSYTWSGPNGFASNAQNPVVNPAVAGTYTVAVTSAGGCTNVATTTVVIAQSPTSTPNNNGPVCAGSILSLTGSGGGTYAWNGPNGFTSSQQNPNINNVTTAASGLYTLVVTVGTCTAPATTSVTVNPKPTPVAANNGPVCSGNTLNLSGNGGTGYAWSGPNSFISSLQNPVISPVAAANAGVYTLTVTNSFGCTNTITTSAVVNAVPVVVVNNPTVCVNQTINLTSNGGSTYVWAGPNGYSSNVQNPSILNATTNMAGNYTVIVTSAGNCTNSSVASVTVYALPAPAITSNTPCAGATLSLSGTGGAAYTWAGPNGFSSATQNPTINNVSMAANGIYTLIATAGTCSNSITGSITVNGLPTPVLNSNSPVCMNQVLTFTAGGGVSYAWSGPNGFAASGSNVTIPSANPNYSGVYNVTVTNASNCTATISTSATVNPLPIIAVMGSTVCVPQSVSLTATGGTSYSWSGPQGFSSSSQFPVIPNSAPAMSGQYAVTVTDVNGCSSTSLTNVQVNTIPAPMAVSNSPICENQLLQFNASASVPVTFIWSGPNGYVSGINNPQIPSAIPAMSGSYTLTITDNIGCKSSAIVPVTVNPLPSGIISTDKKEGCIPVCISFSCQAPSFLQSCNWIFGQSGTSSGLTTTRCYATAGTYTVKANYTDINGCSNNSTYTILANPIPVADFNYAPAKPIMGEEVQFTDASTGAINTGWSWYFSNQTNNATQQNPLIIYPEAGVYAVAMVVTSNKGCKDTITKSIIVG
ncbi:MAG: PKD domain-containing protein [Bacteroidetes bacterium]|nr:PKD domain-containing protein [Bacteroidota bacterium]